MNKVINNCIKFSYKHAGAPLLRRARMSYTARLFTAA